MIAVHAGPSRRHARADGRDTWFSIDPDDSRAPGAGGGSALVGLTETRLQPGAAFPAQPPKDADILLYLCEGGLAHEDDRGRCGVLRAGDFQHVRAGLGIRLRRNLSTTSPAHVVEVHLRPDPWSREPECAQRRFSVAERKGRYCPIAAADGAGGCFALDREILVYSSLPEAGRHLVYPIAPGRQVWLHVVAGRVRLDDRDLIAGDGAACWDAPSVSVTARAFSDLLLIDSRRTGRERQPPPRSE